MSTAYDSWKLASPPEDIYDETLFEFVVDNTQGLLARWTQHELDNIRDLIVERIAAYELKTYGDD